MEWIFLIPIFIITILVMCLLSRYPGQSPIKEESPAIESTVQDEAVNVQDSPPSVLSPIPEEGQAETTEDRVLQLI